jgi:thiosulfate/3-mercaptopyruvate sulfurtransferase
LISVAELHASLEGSTPPVVLDVRWSLGGPPGVDAYRAGHLPGARFVDLDTDLAAPAGSGRGRHPLPDAGTFEAAMRAAGVTDYGPVVVYDAGGGLSAARGWWLLRYARHANVRLLDGGFTAWTAAGFPVSRDAPTVVPGDFTARPGSMPVLDAAGAAAIARAGVLLDARAGERYRGETEPVDPVAGHIPGARSAPTTANLDAGGLFLPAGALRERFERLGATAGVAVGAYCGSGVTAAHEVLALELAGVHAALYTGSWSQWVSDSARPVATGPDEG